MNAVILYLFFFSVAWTLSEGENESKFKHIYVDLPTGKLAEDFDPRESNEKEAAPHLIPFQAYLIITRDGVINRLCSGSLISPRHILTTAYCIIDGDEATVYLGAQNIQEFGNNEVIIQSRNLIPHEQFNDNLQFSDDIGIIVLDEPVKLNQYIDVAALPSRNNVAEYEALLEYNNFVSENVRVSGWNFFSGSGDTPPILMDANSTVISNAECGQVFGSVLESQLCISGVGVGTCNGYYGGALTSGNSLIGILSYEAYKCATAEPFGFTKVASYLGWLEENTGLKF